MSNKELAVQLLTAKLQMKAIVASNPQYAGSVHIPSEQEMIDAVASFADKLSRITDDGAIIVQ